jgi:hypothetical protein
MLAQTATIFRGTLNDVKFTYDDCAGPRINYVFSDAIALAGTEVQSRVTLKVLGGPTPRGTWLGVSELPQLALDSQYVVFLRNTDWTFSPIVGNLVFRRETIAGREVLVEPGGHAVTGWGAGGPLLSASAVSEPVGHQRRGYRRADAPPQTRRASSATADPNPDVKPATGGTFAPAPARTEGSPITSAPSPAEIRTAGLFAKPALAAASSGGESGISSEALLSAISAEARRGRVTIGGRLALEPYWRCWSSTPTVKATARWFK